MLCVADSVFIIIFMLYMIYSNLCFWDSIFTFDFCSVCSLTEFVSNFVTLQNSKIHKSQLQIRGCQYFSWEFFCFMQKNGSLKNCSQPFFSPFFFKNILFFHSSKNIDYLILTLFCFLPVSLTFHKKRLWTFQ